MYSGYPPQNYPSAQGVPPGTQPGPQAFSNSLVTQVELSVSAKNLLDRDVFSKSDPVCIVFAVDPRSGHQMELGRTEQIPNNLNPIWNKKFLLDYRFEERQVLKFVIYDWDGSSAQLSHHDFLGQLECSLGEIVAASGRKFQRFLDMPKDIHSTTKSSLEIVAEELIGTKEVLHIKMNGRKLDKKDFFGKSDPYVIILKAMDDGTFSQVHKTEIIKNTLNPDWKVCTIRVASLTGGKPERKIRFQVFDWDSDGSSDLIGEVETTYAEILAAAGKNDACYPLINHGKKAKKSSYKNSGLLNIEWIKVEEEKSFLDYIQSGVQLHFTVAIDFTASNGDPNSPQSLHYRNPQMDNQYVMAIKSVGEIIQDYDSDKNFPALGFGGRMPNGAVSHEFFLNGNPQNPFCSGVGGILEAYYQSLNTVQLYGPTYFAPVINHVARFASSYQDGKNYFVLLIITDGIICDMDATKEAIIAASVLPMSIIIIGVGQEDFSAMEFLDADGRLLNHNGRTAVRDIVQFVEIQKYTNKYGHDAIQVKADLSKDVLAEIPFQLCDWMRQR